ncbi:signal peptidase I [Enterococcus sp. 7E2_DIV0204]|uniref:Signal peptidase I n=1 Tax=Candidatus Enterococcus lemimoniae TaxID=1834167 RepID=A0ABZ2T3L4_9ENTE|nr:MULTISPECIES: signal peptidase I [unclassified Enterococcus]OTN89913.1 signal peptidase I [Enterococcus sp. 7E2_DIV0204]OTO68776.1 signal peptidase I [Enterococcus sp. 12C11_DIV0727]OTP52369.1 signal peptidase I [Enterococcus sp. 7D2_DIV0200]
MVKGPHFSKKRKQRQTTLSPNKRREQRLNLPKKQSENNTLEHRRSWLKEGFWFFALILVIVFLVVFKTHRVSGKSMAPTFENNDRIIVQKNTSPKRYEIVTFDPEIPNDPSYVKRIIGLPGDQIWTESNAVYIRPSNAAPWQQDEVPKFIISMLPDSTLKVLVHEEVALKLAGLSTIPKGNYFVLGDNRAESKDSRALGLIEEKQIEGVVVFRYFPFNKMGLVH